jgi:AcrR family transcriptional regulator
VPYVKVDDRRGQIVGAARTALTRDGVSATTMRSLAAEAGVPLGTLHYAFQSKDEILRAVLADITRDLAADLDRLARPGAGLAATLRQAVPAGFAREMKRPKTHLLQYELITYALRTPGLGGLARWQYDQHCGIVARWCRDTAAAAGETCAADFGVIARVLVAGIDGLILQYLADPDDDRAARDLDHVITAVVALASPAPAGTPHDGGAPD